MSACFLTCWHACLLASFFYSFLSFLSFFLICLFIYILCKCQGSMLRSSNSHGRHFTESATSIIPVKLAYSDFFFCLCISLFFSSGCRMGYLSPERPESDQPSFYILFPGRKLRKGQNYIPASSSVFSNIKVLYFEVICVLSLATMYTCLYYILCMYSW